VIRHRSDPATAVPAEQAEDEVAAWRREQLVRSGFPWPLAVSVAHDGRYDLHRLIELVERGCRPELALRIVAPLEGEDAA
jgi:hypothetical protein